MRTRMQTLLGLVACCVAGWIDTRPVAAQGNDVPTQNLNTLVEAKELATKELSAKEQELREFRVKHPELKELAARQEALRRLESKVAVFKQQITFVAGMLDKLNSAIKGKLPQEETLALVKLGSSGMSPAEALLADLKACAGRLDAREDGALLQMIRKKIDWLTADLQDAARSYVRDAKDGATGSTNAAQAQMVLELKIRREAMLQEGYGADHPKVKSLEYQINLVGADDSNVNKLVASCRWGLEKDLELLRENLKPWAKKLEAALEDVKGLKVLVEQENRLCHEVEVRQVLLDTVVQKLRGSGGDKPRRSFIPSNHS